MTLNPKLDSSCVLALSFGEESGNIAYDQSQYGNDGTIYGATRVRGLIGKALSFDGVDDYVDCGNIQPLGQSLTIALWSKRLGSTGSYGTLLSIDGKSWTSIGGLLIFDWNNGKIAGRVRNGSDNSETQVLFETDVPNGVWRHYVLVWDKPVLRAYRNGELVDEKNWNHDIGWNVYETIIGKWADLYFNGIIDEVRIYNRALSEKEIRTLYYYGIQSLRHAPYLLR